MFKYIKSIHNYKDISGLIPGVKGQRAFPTNEFSNSDPFVMLDHIGPELVGKEFFLDGTGHDHPHRGFETLTFMFEGNMDHRDSLGNKIQLKSGDIQRMNAGSGIIHGGDMGADTQTERFHELQLWINNPSTQKMSEPEVQNVPEDEIPSLTQGDLKLRVISGTLNGLKGNIKTKARTQIAHLIAQDSGIIEVGSFEENSIVMVYILEGSVLVSDEVIRAFQLAVFHQDGNKIRIETENHAQLLILSGIPLNEPVAYGGPFVMNTMEEINQAHKDYQEGKFGIIDS